MILDIKTYPDKILTKKTRPIREFDANLQKLIDDMAETLYAKHGAGLAANQVGESKQIIVVDGGEGLKVLINPKITRSRGQMIYAEGCLSFPGIELFIK
ncbi:MAG: peptide deformylase, partial [Patescibacteria group bacterium]